MNFFQKLTKAGAFICLLGATSLFAGEDAKAWLLKMAENYSKAFTVDYLGDMSLDTNGMNMKMAIKGKMTYRDARHMRMKLDIEMNMGEQLMSMNMFQVADGTTMWMKMNMMGNDQVMKMDLGEMEKMLEDGSGNLGQFSNILSMNPMHQIENMSKIIDFKLDGIADGKVTLTGVMNDEFFKTMGANQGPMPEGFDGQMVMILNKKSAFIEELILGSAEKPLMKMRFENLKFLKPDNLGDDLFQFTPPEGVPVMDLIKQMKAGQGDDIE